MRVYVGEFGHCPDDGWPASNWFNFTHPRDFKAKVAELTASPGRPDAIWTNNPYLVSCFEPKDVFVCAAGPDGKVVIRPLTDHPRHDQWVGEMDAGELWSMWGEAWVLER